MLGDKTHKAKGVKKEIEIARKLGKEVVQVKPKNRNAQVQSKKQELYTRYKTHSRIFSSLRNKIKKEEDGNCSGFNRVRVFF